MKIGVVGLGLIGGSLGISLQSAFPKAEIIGVDLNNQHASQALDLSLVHEISKLEDAIPIVDVLILCIPVNGICSVAQYILDHISPNTLVIDFGSTKQNIKHALGSHSLRKQWILAHPMAGTEYSGPKAAIPQLFENRLCILCDLSENSRDAVSLASELLMKIGMRISEMNAQEHDLHAAYISHLSHISSFALSNTVLEKEANGANHIRLMAGAGFRSTVRLAKSNADMWGPIVLDNSEVLLPALESYISELKEYADAIRSQNMDRVKQKMKEANLVGPIVDNEIPIEQELEN